MHFFDIPASRADNTQGQRTAAGSRRRQWNRCSSKVEIVWSPIGENPRYFSCTEWKEDGPRSAAVVAPGTVSPPGLYFVDTEILRYGCESPHRGLRVFQICIAPQLGVRESQEIRSMKDLDQTFQNHPFRRWCPPSCRYLKV